MDEAARHLDLLAVFHYVVAGIFALFGCFPIIHLVVGLTMLAGGFDNKKPGAPPDWFGLIFVFMAVMMIAVMWTFAGAVALAGSRLQQRRSYMYCLVIAALECTFAPFGTVLGVFTIVVLCRPSVKALFGVASPSAST